MAEHFEALALYILPFDAGEIDVHLGALTDAVALFGEVQQLLGECQRLVGEGTFFFEEQDAVEGFLDLFHQLSLCVLYIPPGAVQASARNLDALAPFATERKFLRELHGIRTRLLACLVPFTTATAFPFEAWIVGERAGLAPFALSHSNRMLLRLESRIVL